MSTMRSDSSLSPNRQLPHPPWDAEGCPACGCRCGGAGRLTMKRKLDFAEDPEGQQASSSPSALQALHLPLSPPGGVMGARVDPAGECLALHETVARQGQLIQELYRDLEEERSASSSSASEAMSMILRLQREKSEVQMEARQFRQYAEEKMAHDQQEVLALEDVCFRRDQTIQSLLCEVQAYRHRMLSYGVDPDAAVAASPPELNLRGVDHHNDDNNTAASYALPVVDSYPSLSCRAPNAALYDDLVVKYAAGDTPRTPGSSTRDQLQHIEQRIWQMERHASGSHLSVLEKEVVLGNSPLPSRLDRRMSWDSSSSFLTTEVIQESTTTNNNYHDVPPALPDRLSQVTEDKMSDRVYTVIDPIDGVAPSTPAPVWLHEDYSVVNRDGGSEQADIKKLYMRLQALEADRENLKQAIVSMRTDPAHMLLLKQLADNFTKGVPLQSPVPTLSRPLRNKPSLLGAFSFVSAIKWMISFQWMASVAFWKKKTKRCKYMLRLTNGKVGLLLVLDKALFTRQWRCLTRPIS